MDADRAQLYIRLRSRTDGAWIAPPELKERIVNEAIDRASSMQDVAVGILCAEFGVPFEASGRKASAALWKLEINLSVPQKLDSALRLAGARARPAKSRQDVALAVLARHFGLRLPAPPSRRRRRTRAPRPAAA